MENDVDKAINGLRNASKNTSELLKRLSNSSKILDKHSSATLFSITGGILSATLGAGLCYFTGFSFLILSAPFTVLGLTVGILIHRGPRRIRLEKRIAENRLACDEILSRIKNLPTNAPDEVKQELWSIYRQLNNNYERQINILLAPRKQEADGLLLPWQRR